MKEKLLSYRNTIYNDAWEKFKNTLTMEELTEIFSTPISLKSLYRILKAQIPIKGKVVSDKKSGNRVIYEQRQNNRTTHQR